MKVLLIGYGKMGKTIEQILLERGHQIAYIVDKDTAIQLKDVPMKGADVAIEFTEPSAAPANLRACFSKQIPVVCGTTGWLDQRPLIEKECAVKNGGFFYASNYSLGVNIFFRLNERLAQMMKPYPQYKVSIEEIHHTEKKDAPSGTAITLAEGILEHLTQYLLWEKGENAVSHPDRLPIHSKRLPNVPGTHLIRYTSEEDTIEITHIAHTRKGFALGAVIAAEWMQGRRGIFGMKDLLGF
ncbi:MAG: 4-hydroxy-tetrahydrodipicolinate reductase [Flammeovirgaceae bacterium]|nr:4-hydroxy-tetrahydrodipicolinate reductase [Flammeovirgaceae bacterium]MDW8288801.1 4-hydroxy-tetrahydrodipicolinate reductase [Flammeovirgaceae bacterium]